MLIRRVYTNKKSGAKLITIPRRSDIEPGDYVIIKKISSVGNEPLVIDFDEITKEFIEYAMKNLDISQDEVVRRVVREYIQSVKPRPGRPKKGGAK